MIQWVTIFLLTNYTVSKQIKPDEIVKVNASKVIVQVGRDSVISVEVDVRRGYHIQAHEVSDEFLIPTTLEIDGGKEIVIKNQAFPSAKKFKLKGTDKYLDVYDGKFKINTFFTTQKGIQKNIYQINGKLKYQACDSMRCYFPKTIEFLIDVEVR